MKFPLLLRLLDFRKLDTAIDRMIEIRDSYRAENRAVFGDELAELLNDWN